MRKEVYLDDEEKQFVDAQPKGFIRELVRGAMGERVVPKKMVVISKKGGNPNSCRKCGQIKSSGRCINNNCEMKGRLQ